jgi:threonine/homoserine/homoserine lactone efflux protein
MWVAVSVSLGFAGVAVLAWCAFKVWLGVRRLGRELERTKRRLEPKRSALSDELSRLPEPRPSQTPDEGVRSA